MSKHTLFAFAFALAAVTGLAAPQAMAEPGGLSGKVAEPPEGLPTPDDFVRDAARHPPEDPAERAKILDGLYDRLAKAPEPQMAKAIAQAIERVWRSSGSPTCDLLLTRAAAAIEAKRMDLAMVLLESAMELQPDFAEAWNRRAYAYYLGGEHQRALGDLRRVLALDPKHFRALEGVGLILREIGEKKAALEAYKKLKDVYPFFEGAQKAIDELTPEVEGQGI